MIDRKHLLISFACTTLVGLSCAAAQTPDSLAYVFTKSDQFGIIDLNTGAYTQFSITAQQPAGMGMVGGSLYVAGYGSSALFQVNPTNGVLKLVNYSNIKFYDLGSTLTQLYGLDQNGDLYAVNPSTAAATLVGPTGYGQSGNTLGLSTNSNALFLAVNSKLYLVNTVTGAATLLGATGVKGIGSMVYENGQLYAGVTQPTSQIYTLNTSTGAGTQVATPSGNPAPGNLWALAPAAPQTGLSLATTRSGLCGNDFFYWSQLPAPVSTVATPVNITSAVNALPATLTSNAGSVFTDQQTSALWDGNFGSNDFLIGTGDSGAASPIEITFANPVWGVGAQMGYGANGSFLAGISLFGPGNVPLGSYDVSGIESSAGDNSAPFIGVLESAEAISTVEFFTLSSFGADPGEFAINQVSVNTVGPALAASSGTPQSTGVGTAFANPLTVTLTDPCGNPLAGVAVTFTAPASGASAVLSAGSAFTASNGTASVTASANGTPGSYTVAATAYGLSANFSLTNVGPPRITTPSPLPAGHVDSLYSLTLTAAGGVPPYSNWLVSSGTLPAGLSLSPSSGTINGTPTTAGNSFSFSVTVNDSAGNVSAPAAFSLSVGPHVALAAVKLPHQTALGGSTTTDNQAILNGPAPQAGAVVSLSSGNPAVASVPASVTVAAGETSSAVFSIATTPVGTNTPVTISATYRGVTKTATLTVEAAQLTTLTLDPTEIKGGGSTARNTIKLSGKAPAGGAVVTLTSGNPAVASVPPTATVPAGAASVAFTIVTTAVTSQTVVQITATYNGVSEMANLTVEP
ncbi:MAG: putative Ig domain-containing protein [Bryobacteraceae bacterium]|jgi:hypothetical protein